jgi:fucose permease
MCKIIVVANQKGGVAKTSTVRNLSHSLTELGKRVLAVDFDPQFNLTTCFGIENPNELDHTTATLMTKMLDDVELPPKENFIRSIGKVDLIPSSIQLSLAFWIIAMKNSTVKSDTATPSLPIPKCLRVVISNLHVWIVGVCLMCILAANIAISSLLPTTLSKLRGVSSVAAGAYSTAITLGFLVGCLVTPIIASKLGRMKPLMFMFGLISAFGVAFAWMAPIGVFLWIGLFITGVTMGGLMPLLTSIPIQLSDIGPTYAGTAGGFTGTLELLGAVVIPTYIIAPIAGTNMNLFFLLGSICMIVLCVFVLFLPELGKNAKKEVEGQKAII